MAAWTRPYSISQNYISDLGALYSPLHTLMNVSMTVQGVLIFGGALHLKSGTFGRRSIPAYLALCLAALGSIVLACFPEDIAPTIHYSGAAVHLVSANLALLLLGLRASGRQRVYLGGCGILGLVATTALVSPQVLSIGIGTIERFAAYPLPLCLAALGARQIFVMKDLDK